MNCIKPINWEYCLPVQDWLVPGIQEAWEIKTNPDLIYKSERDYLKTIK